MKTTKEKQQDRVRRSTPEEINKEIDQEIIGNIGAHSSSPEAIGQRLQELKNEWDIEKTLEVNASTLALAGVLLGAFVNRKWFILPGVVTTFLLQHGLQGWCPPLPVFRAMGIRTRQEINEEKMALKALRGDFKAVSDATSPSEVLRVIRKS
ncbi:DUF2892 domain-containing protein [Botryobacter ruber]|uniref:DUF2892 domain-containing protein n=1 Tax=Botryobacter ruber TaxID=2171629 RepID=UPI000E0C0BD8|nr:DUF2892 domain-containing protein [Botryobacter ruber]